MKMNLQFFGTPVEETIDMLEEVDENTSNLDAATQIELAKLVQLKRIADILEKYGGTLTSISSALGDLSDCTDGDIFAGKALVVRRG